MAELPPSCGRDYMAAGPHPFHVEPAEWHDDTRQRRLPLRLYLPADTRDCPTVLFSHGLGGTRLGGEVWLRHWASWGILGIALQHPGSDETVFAGRSRMALRQILRESMNPAQLEARAGDLSFVIDMLEHGRLPQADPGRVGIAGHSFGAVTVQALAGERLTQLGRRLHDPRPLASLALSPSARGEADRLAERFGHIDRPFFSITGTRDDGIGLGDIDPGNRTLPYQHMPAPDKYLLVLDQAGHLAFSGHASAAEKRLSARDTSHQRRIAPLVCGASTAFWVAQLRPDPKAGIWLRNRLPGLLQTADRFASK